MVATPAHWVRLWGAALRSEVGEAKATMVTHTQQSVRTVLCVHHTPPEGGMTGHDDTSSPETDLV